VAADYVTSVALNVLEVETKSGENGKYWRKKTFAPN
jgi:hypothetical protein